MNITTSSSSPTILYIVRRVISLETCRCRRCFQLLLLLLLHSSFHVFLLDPEVLCDVLAPESFAALLEVLPLQPHLLEVFDGHTLRLAREPVDPDVDRGLVRQRIGRQSPVVAEQVVVVLELDKWRTAKN